MSKFLQYALYKTDHKQTNKTDLGHSNPIIFIYKTDLFSYTNHLLLYREMELNN